MSPAMTPPGWTPPAPPRRPPALPAPSSASPTAATAPPLPPPFAPDVFRERQARLRAAARAGAIDAIFVTPSTNLSYAANLSIGRSERLTALLLFTDGPAVLVTPFFEADNHRRDAVVDDVVTWREDEDPFAAAAKALGKAKALGIEGSTAWDTGAGSSPPRARPPATPARSATVCAW